MENSNYTIQAGVFKAKCLDLMDKVYEQHISIIITKHGKPVARLMPIEETPIDFFGCLKDTVTIKGDIINPIEANWEANE